MNKSCFKAVLCCLLMLLSGVSGGYTQSLINPNRFFFISDTQVPMFVETLILDAYRNEEARDSLFADVIRQNPRTMFMTGDLISTGSSEKAWAPTDRFLNTLNKINAKTYAIPGNHEYMVKSSWGIQKFKNRFPVNWLFGYTVTVDSIAVIMLNSNFNELSIKELGQQLSWYKSALDSLDANPAILAIFVCTHHSPYSNSKVEGCSQPVIDLIVPAFEKSKKSKLFISGHSHNLEYFSEGLDKHFLVIGGGGGIAQPLIPMNDRIHHDLLPQESKPVYFYLIVERNKNFIKLTARGFKKDFNYFYFDIGTITL